MNIFKIVSEQNNYYLFDGFSNEIYQLDNNKDLDDVSINDIDSFKTYQNIIPKDYKKNITNYAKTLILEITEQCNLRCSYCVFDENYDSEREHSSFIMSQETAFNAIDNYKSRINANEAYIVFYGGEPLIRYSFIEEIVEYAKKAIGGFVKYSFTTNGVFLTKEKIIF